MHVQALPRPLWLPGVGRRWSPFNCHHAGSMGPATPTWGTWGDQGPSREDSVHRLAVDTHWVSVIRTEDPRLQTPKDGRGGFASSDRAEARLHGGKIILEGSSHLTFSSQPGPSTLKSQALAAPVSVSRSGFLPRARRPQPSSVSCLLLTHNRHVTKKGYTRTRWKMRYEA